MRFALLLAAACLAGPACAASFDCKKASTPAEHAICASPKLSALDDLVSRSYGEVRNGSAGTTPDPDDRAHAAIAGSGASDEVVAARPFAAVSGRLSRPCPELGQRSPSPYMPSADASRS